MIHPSDGPVLDDRVLASPARLRAVRDVELLDTPDEELFDRWAIRATELTESGTALLSLVDATRSYFKSFRLSDGSAGTGRDVPIEISLCREVVVRGEPMIIPDTLRDARTKDYGAVQAFPVGAYAGLPLRSTDGQVLGSFCVVDAHARPWTAAQIAALEDLTAAVQAELRLRASTRHNRRHEALMDTHQRIHRLMLDGAPRADVLAELLAGVEQHTDGMRASIDEQPARPALPEPDRRAALALAPVPPLSSWSVPIIGAHGASRGTFGLRGHGPEAPLAQDLALLQQAARLAAIVIERDEASQELQRLASCDPLTGLPNRAWLLERLGGRLRAASENRDVAVLFCDLDHFKLINDSLGHDIGDAVLVEVARRLTASVRAEDLVARLGGDEFVIVLDGVHDQASAQECARRHERALAEPILSADGRAHVVHASIGVALVNAVGAQEALRRADHAMYAVKRTPTRVGIYDSDGDTATSSELRMLDALHEAVDRDELHLVYQPIVDLSDDTVHDVEALARWSHTELGNVGPAQFIRLAEEHGLIDDIGGWVFRHAIAQTTRWAAAGISLGVSVNLSAHQLRNRGLTKSIMAALKAAHVSAGDVTIEITETALMIDEPTATRNLASLREAGMRVLLDDFGTGFSSLTHLRTLPITGLKIDRSFIAHITDRPADLALVQGLLAMTHGLGLDVIAEGVETAHQAQALRDLGCRYAQGYHFARPRRAEDVDDRQIAAGS